jgi:thiamine biosynthesis lipoprotein
MTRADPITRRAMLTITAAAGATALFHVGSRAARLEAVEWRGVALGAPATIRLYGHERGHAQATLDAVGAEIRRLEAIFSLHRDDSALARLNRDRRLAHPPAELVTLLSQARGIAEATGGAFDPSIQPLWQLYGDHFARHPRAREGPSDADIARALSKVGHRHISIRPDLIALDGSGMQLSLNGIAQGFITDRAARLIRRAAFSQVLVDLGEIRALDRHPSGRPWRIGIRSPSAETTVLRKLSVVDQAVATSAPGGTTFEPDGRFHHLLDPRTGRCASHYQTLTVTAPNATLADGLSTAFAIMPWPEVERQLARRPGIRVDALLASGAWRMA